MHDECRLEQLLLQDWEEVRRWMLMHWYGQILGGLQLSLIVLSLAPHWPEFSALWANGGSPSRETRPARLTGQPDHLLSTEQIQATDMNVKPEPERNELIGQKQRLSASSYKHKNCRKLTLTLKYTITSLTKQTQKSYHGTACWYMYGKYINFR